MTLEVMYKPFRMIVRPIQRLLKQSQLARDQEQTDRAGDDVVDETTVSVPVPPALRDSANFENDNKFEQTVKVKIDIPHELIEHAHSVEAKASDSLWTVERTEDYLADIITLERSYYIDGESVEK